MEKGGYIFKNTRIDRWRDDLNFIGNGEKVNHLIFINQSLKLETGNFYLFLLRTFKDT
jgi:hypothetical protein